ncbi:MAG: TonB-dependent receptor [Opitutaceae bacterium]
MIDIPARVLRLSRINGAPVGFVALALALASVPEGRGQSVTGESTAAENTVTLDPFVVVAERTFAGNGGAIGQPTWSKRRIDLELPVTLDGLLKKNPTVSTYRRTTGLTAHPTTQGVRLRDTATNATSRALVLLAGVPQNDPFGGWIEWNRLPLEGLKSIRLYANGQQAAWGNLSSGGVISLTPEPLSERAGRITVEAGSLETFQLTAGQVFPVNERTTFAVDGTAFTTGGYVPVAARQRGPVDEKAWSRFGTASARIEHHPNDTLRVNAAISIFREERGNGTALSGNDSTGSDLSIEINGASGPDSTWQATVFFQRRGIRNVFTSVNEDRTAEQPALDQYDVPADAGGASLSWGGLITDKWNLLAGIDLRTVDGEVNEMFRNLGQGFTRDRSAGGRQLFAGGFAGLRYEASPLLSFEGTLRIDHWRGSDGFRREKDLQTSVILSDAEYTDTSGWEPTLGLAMEVKIARDWKTDLRLSRGFRSPTLNELYRPFRVGNDLTESNPGLQPETTLGLEWGLSFDGSSPIRADVRAFAYRLDDMITNVFRVAGPVFDPIFGFVPAGGTGSQRQNVERSSALGGELRLSADFTRNLSGNIHFVHTETRFETAPTQPALEGLSFSQAPANRLAFELNWRPSESADGSVRLNHSSSQFEDPLNTRSLDSATTVDLAINTRWPGTPWSVGLAAHNLLNANIQAGMTSGGLITVAEPRMLLLTVRYSL